MAYLQPAAPRRLAPLAAVAIVHVAIGYAFISGLAMKVIPWEPTAIEARIIPPDTVPPENPPEPRAPDRAGATPAVQQREVAVVDLPTVDLNWGTRTVDPAIVDPIAPTVAEVTKPTPDLTRAAAPRGNRARWITTDDYPAAAIRAEQEGTVGISVRIAGNGRVSECTVTQSSGHRALDDATCSLYRKTALFEPARDRDGNVTATSYSDRIVWRLP